MKRADTLRDYVSTPRNQRPLIVCAVALLMCIAMLVGPSCRAGGDKEIDWAATQLGLEYSSLQLHDLALMTDGHKAADLELAAQATGEAASVLKAYLAGAATASDLTVTLQSILVATEVLLQESEDEDVKFAVASLRAMINIATILISNPPLVDPPKPPES